MQGNYGDSSNKSYRELLLERQGRGFPEHEVVEVLRQILPALAEMHSAGKAHGAISLKSLVRSNGSAKLIDAVPGLKSYAKDIFELGLVVITLLTAKTPRSLKNEDGTWNWDDHCVVSDRTTEIINRMLAVNPTTRFNTALEVLTAMGLDAVPTATNTFQSATTSRLPNKSMPTWLWAAIGAGSTVIVALAGFGIWSLVAPRTQSQQTQGNASLTASPIVQKKAIQIEQNTRDSQNKQERTSLIPLPKPDSSENIQTGMPTIISITSIFSDRDRTIKIRGSGFGTLDPYEGNSAFIRISNITGGWNAGSTRDSPSDYINLNITLWTTTEITISSFTGSYGNGNWKFNNGDLVMVQIWNAQTGVGPATCSFSVNSQQQKTCTSL
jgi:serine/threonine protein kinase